MNAVDGMRSCLGTLPPCGEGTNADDGMLVGRGMDAGRVNSVFVASVSWMLAVDNTFKLFSRTSFLSRDTLPEPPMMKPIPRITATIIAAIGWYTEWN